MVKEKSKKTIDHSKYHYRYVALHISYFGFNYQGFASQNNTFNTIEYHLIKALKETSLIEEKKTSNYTSCGRTDAGVSASSQIISIYLRSKQKKESFKGQLLTQDEEINYIRLLNGFLPKDIRIIRWTDIPKEFNARYSAVSRIYRYYFVKGGLDIDQMKKACNYFIGKHDFRNFCTMDIKNVSYFEREIFNFNLNENDTNILFFEIEANAFLQNQIRMMTAILFLIGNNKEKPSLIKTLLEVDKYPRKPQYNMSNPYQLVLYKVNYDEIKFKTDNKSIKLLLNSLNNLWREYTIKAEIINQFMDVIDENQNIKSDKQIFNSVTDKIYNKSKYIKILDRPTGKSYQEKVNKNI
ncbi:tRNA pseudouridine synthase [seawater metagenome]|uniref:tRNA pseudouridine synthase n=1 Tax=seawater metagenome TaxID=1561972 RepID=A0A5E8CIK5_9ZZZZ